MPMIRSVAAGVSDAMVAGALAGAVDGAVDAVCTGLVSHEMQQKHTNAEMSRWTGRLKFI